MPCRISSGSTIPNVLSHAKKNGMTIRKILIAVIPPKADAEYVANMEEVLETRSFKLAFFRY